MPTNALPRASAQGPGTRVEHSAAVALADGDTYDTGLDSIDAVQTTGTSADTVVAVTNVAGGTITVSMETGGTAVTNAETVYVDAIGEA